MGKDPPESESKAKGLISKLGRWTGFGDKTLWNILELLIVPAVLAFGAFYLEEQASNRQEQIATARYQQEALAKYFDQMTQLLLEKKLRQPGSEAQAIARARTLSTLGELDESRKGLLLKFLYEAKLISQNKPVVSLIDADLSGAQLSGANLQGADLTRTNLSGGDLHVANLQGANLQGAYLTRTNLSGARLHVANLQGAYLQGAYLSGAYLNYAQLSGADLTGADLTRTNLSGADLTGADLTGAKNIEPDQVKAARFWKEAKYSPDFRKQLVQVGVNKQTIR